MTKDMSEKMNDKSPSFDMGTGEEASVGYALEEEKHVLRKIDRVVLPLMYLDKQSIGYAAVFNLSEDLGMDSHQYSWSVSSFYFGQLLANYIFIYLISRLPITKFVGISVMVWGIIAGSLAAPNNFGGFTAVRTMLGFAEGAVQPAFVIITSTWYKKSEHSFRVAGWVTCNGVAQVLGALIMFGVGSSKETAIATWRAISWCAAVVLCSQVPDTAWFLTESKRVVASKRLSQDRLSKDVASFEVSQIWEFVKDHRALLLVLGAFTNTLASPVIKVGPQQPNYYIETDLAQFATLVINGFGWSKLNTMLVSLPTGVIQIISIWVVVIGIRVTSIPRGFWGIIATVIPLIGNIGVATLPQSSKWVVFLSLIASNVKGNTKKSAASNGFFVLYAAAAIAGPQLWTDKPRYTKGIIADLVALGGNINRHRERNNYVVDEAPGDADVTDKQDLSFRYTL
ncbi:hypothetical protein LCI18_003216 [Fusarium solani-melongenae]|uniref:Uncharacterized protein n=1 Tax=Fusarium solani subsp. cucurbitae TaxID=2747967 RepID=A0ACD3YTR8_FUSSC|nr:hypothetical protein LCI18_003216 [Fusarium solani-melongenae]